MCLNLVWAPVLHTEAYRHRLEAGMIDEGLRHSRERAPSEPSPCALVPSPPTSKDNVMHQSSSQIFPPD